MEKGNFTHFVHGLEDRRCYLRFLSSAPCNATVSAFGPALCCYRIPGESFKFSQLKEPVDTISIKFQILFQNISGFYVFTTGLSLSLSKILDGWFPWSLL